MEWPAEGLPVELGAMAFPAPFANVAGWGDVVLGEPVAAYGAAPILGEVPLAEPFMGPTPYGFEAPAYF